MNTGRENVTNKRHRDACSKSKENMSTFLKVKENPCNNQVALHIDKFLIVKLQFIFGGNRTLL